jgi:hypothetical protein
VAGPAPRGGCSHPAQLPADIAGFTGRGPELEQLQRHLAGASGAAPVVVCAIHGAGGIGKSALAIHAAHRMACVFPDGQLYVDLQGPVPVRDGFPAAGRRGGR